MRKKKIFMICLAILGITALALVWIFTTAPTARSEGATRQMATLVEVMPVGRGDYQPLFVATGTVSPTEDVVLSAQVAGKVIHRSPSFVPGGYVPRGTLLLQIEPADYEHALAQRRSELMQARSQLILERGRQAVAQQDLALIGKDSLSPEELALVLRNPQLEAALAEVTAAQATLEQAVLNLERTRIRAPFDAHILSQKVTEGSQVAPGDDLGQLVGTPYYWVIIHVPVSRLQWLEIPGPGEKNAATVKIRNTSAWPEDTYRTGYLSQQVGALNEETRLARLLVKVPDPLSRQQESKGLPELIIGSFVEAEIRGQSLKDVFRVDRSYLHNENQVWVMKDEKLDIRKVEILLKDSRYVYFRSGLTEKEQIVISPLSMVAEGIPLRTSGSDSPSSTQTGM